MALGNGCEHAGQIGMRLDVVQLTGLNDGREHRPVLCASIMTREERVFAVQRLRSVSYNPK